MPRHPMFWIVLGLVCLVCLATVSVTVITWRGEEHAVIIDNQSGQRIEFLRIHPIAGMDSL